MLRLTRKAVRVRIINIVTWLNHLPIWRIGVNVWGSRLRATTADRAVYLLLNKLGLMAGADLRLIERLLQPEMTVVDVGANIGCYTLKFARMVGPQGFVHSFEPNPELATQLAANATANGLAHVQVHPLALGSAAGRTRLLIGPVNSGDSFVEDAAEAGRGGARRSVEVDVDTLDHQLDSVAVDFVKIDVQGAEIAVLRGMERLIESLPALMIYLEFHAPSIQGAGAQPVELLQQLQGSGLVIYREQRGHWMRLEDMDAFAQECARRPGYYTNLLAARPGNPHVERIAASGEGALG